MDAFLFALTLVFIPGLVCRILLGRLIFYKDSDKFYFLLHSFILGVICYAILSLGYFVLYRIGVSCSPFDYQGFFIGRVEAMNIFFATLIAVPVAFIFSIAEKNNWLHSIALALRITNKTAEPDIWAFTFNQEAVTENSWVNVRYNGLVYQGTVIAYSDVSDKPELLLGNVKVLSEDSSFEPYSVNTIYLSLVLGEFTIELLI